jgi:hypothetical protein
MLTVFDLMRATARRLTSKHVELRILTGGYPVLEGRKHVMGTTFANLAGNPTITLYHGPHTTGAAGARYFLHECAHAKLHASQLARRQDYTPTITPTITPAAPASWETEAEALADHWMRYALAHVKPWERGDFGALLMALYEAPSEKLR